MDDVTTSVWNDEMQDATVDNMLLLISGSSGKPFEKHFWEDKGLIDGPGNMVEEGIDPAEIEGGMPLKKKSKSNVIDGNNIDILKTYFLSLMEQMTKKLQKEISTSVNGLVEKIDSRMEKIEESIKEVQETSKNIEARVTTYPYSQNVQEAGPSKENSSKKQTTCSYKTSGKKSKSMTTCSNKTSGKKSKSMLSRYELKDISVEELQTEEDSVDCEKGNANSQEQEESSVKALSETSSIRDRNMKMQMDKFAKDMEALIKKPVGKEKRIRKLTAPLKHPFISTNATKKIKIEDQPCTAYDPFELVDETLVTTLDQWITRDVTVVCGSSREKVGKTFFRELRTPQTYISNSHTDAGMTLFRRRLLMNPCPYRGGRMAFMDTVFTLVISRHYKEFDENPKKYKWNSIALNYYNGVLPSAGCTNKQLGKDVDDIYVVIHIKGNHWAALNISIQSRTIHVYDSIIAYTSDKEMEKYVMPYARMVPHMLKAFASDQDKKGMSVAKYKISRKYDIPQNIITGDCGVYAIKYIECLALGCHFTGLCDEHIERIRAKLAAEIFDESKNMSFY